MARDEEITLGEVFQLSEYERPASAGLSRGGLLLAAGNTSSGGGSIDEAALAEFHWQTAVADLRKRRMSLHVELAQVESRLTYAQKRLDDVRAERRYEGQ